MNYYLDLFTPETWEGFRKNGGTVSGFRERQRRSAEKIKQGDLFVCYLVRLSRWCGILEVESEPYTDNTPIFSDPDPFSIRFNVAPKIVLDVESSIPIFQDEIWSQLSLTRDISKRAFGWAQAANLRASLRQLSKDDGDTLANALQRQRRLLQP